MKQFFSMFAICLITGCSMVQATTQSVRFTCVQPGTDLRINGEKKDCPSVLDLPRNQSFTVEARKEGYTPNSRQIDSHLGTAGKLDIVGLCFWFFPVFGLMTPGAWDLDRTDVNVDLFPI